MPNAILDPTGGLGRAPAPAAQGAVLAPRRGDLAGATVGLLVNTKQNADIFLEEVGRLLVERHGAGAHQGGLCPAGARGHAQGADQRV
jgi:hypothetical protein